MHKKILFIIMLCASVVTVVQSEALRPFVAHNPLIADGSLYTADPAPFVVKDTLYVLTGIDMAPPDVNDFVMPAWALLTSDNPAGSSWRKQVPLTTPEAVFEWAQPARAYAGQIFPAQDGRFYLFAPVVLKEKRYVDNFAIGVAVASSPTGPWQDAIGHPLISQGVRGADTLQNIDPTLWQDTSGKVVMIWGTFGELRGVELATDLRSLKGEVKTLSGAKGFFEAPWLLARNGIYYLFYAANNRQDGLRSGCSPTLYYACIAWATASDPLGEWKYQGVLLPPVSSTTSHPGIVKFQDAWWLFYHTADGKEGGTFRRSVSRDKLVWDDTVTPAKPMVTSTSVSHNDYHKPGNVAYRAQVDSSSTKLPGRYWLDAVNNGKTRMHPLPPELWSTEGSPEPERAWVEYEFEKPVMITRTRLSFTPYSDKPAQVRWSLQAHIEGEWRNVVNHTGIADNEWHEATFEPVAATRYRVVLPHKDSEGEFILMQEWELYQ